MSHGSVSFIPISVPFYFSNLDPVQTRQGSGRAALRLHGCCASAACCWQNMQGMKFSSLCHFLYLGHIFHKIYIWDPSFLSSSHHSTHNWMILNIGSELDMRSNWINQHSCRNLISFGNQDKNPAARILKVQGGDSLANDATNNSYQGMLVNAIWLELVSLGGWNSWAC